MFYCLFVVHMCVLPFSFTKLFSRIFTYLFGFFFSFSIAIAMYSIIHIILFCFSFVIFSLIDENRGRIETNRIAKKREEIPKKFLFLLDLLVNIPNTQEKKTEKNCSLWTVSLIFKLTIFNLTINAIKQTQRKIHKLYLLNWFA